MILYYVCLFFVLFDKCFCFVSYVSLQDYMLVLCCVFSCVYKVIDDSFDVCLIICCNTIRFSFDTRAKTNRYQLLRTIVTLIIIRHALVLLLLRTQSISCVRVYVCVRVRCQHLCIVRTKEPVRKQYGLCMMLIIFSVSYTVTVNMLLQKKYSLLGKHISLFF